MGQPQKLHKYIPKMGDVNFLERTLRRFTGIKVTDSNYTLSVRLVSEKSPFSEAHRCTLGLNCTISYISSVKI